MRNLLVSFLIGSKFFWSTFLLFRSICHLVTDPAATAIHALGLSLWVFCRSVSKEKTQSSNLLMNSKCFSWYLSVELRASCTLYFLCWENWMKYWIDLAMGHHKALSERSRHLTQALMNRTKVGVTGNFCRKRLSSSKKGYGADKIGILFGTGPTDAVKNRAVFLAKFAGKMIRSKPKAFMRFCSICRESPISPRWKVASWDTWVTVLDFRDKPLTDVELEQQKYKIRKGPPVLRDREQPFTE